LSKNYSEDDIKVLSEIEHIHKRTSMYLGTTEETEYQVPLLNNTFEIANISFIPAVMKLFSEIVDNANDELIQANVKSPTITITADYESQIFSVEDNGRGIPIGKHETGKYTPEVVFTSLRSGRNFSDNKQKGVIGLNGVGSSIVCMCSEWFEIEIYRDGKCYKQLFSDASRIIGDPIISKSKRISGTKVSFKLMDGIFKDKTLPESLIRNRAVELAATNPNTKIILNDEEFLYKRGFPELVSNYFDESILFGNDEIEFHIIRDFHKGQNELIFSWVNSSFLYNGGICNTQFMNAFVDKTISHLATIAKKRKIKLTRGDVLTNLLFLGNLKVSDPQYDSQAKTKLTGPNLRKPMDDIIEAKWKLFVRNNKDWLEEIVERAVRRSNVAATKDILKDVGKSKKIKLEGFMDATSKQREECQLLITEGLSARANIVESRNPETMAALPLTGKINNVYGASVAELMKMGKVSDLINVIGLVPGKRAIRSELRYGKVHICSDADTDGDHICALLINLFYQFWPELFDPRYPPFFHRMVVPNIVAVKGKKRIHFPNRGSYEVVKNKYKSYEISYLKGLATMSRVDWAMILGGEFDSCDPIQDIDGTLADVMKLLFSPDVDARKEWLHADE